MDNSIKELKRRYVEKRKEIFSRLREFSTVNSKDIFYELCFCLLTPQTNAKVAYRCVEELKKRDFLNKEVDPKPILMKKIRFYNNKSNYLIECKKQYKLLINHLNKIKNNKEKREFMVKNVKGLGYKESSHFLRNIGYKNLAILDRHILKNLLKLRVINNIPDSLNKKNYLDIESKFYDFSKRINIPMDELDLLFWSFKTGEIFK